jgi:hypothetical protein
MSRQAMYPVALLLSALLTACGGGSSGGSSGPGISTGQLKDSNVQGARYVTGARSGLTGADGSFSYESGSTVTFSIGGVTLGTAPGKRVIHPVDLVSNGSSSNTSVLNLARFLLMLDTDSTPDNGIQISDAVRAMAENWTQVDFATTDLDTALNSIISDVASANGSAPVLPSTNEAVAHIEDSFLCTHAGAIIGAFEGSDQGFFGLSVDPLSGKVLGSAYSPGRDLLYTFEAGTELEIKGQPRFTSEGNNPFDISQPNMLFAGRYLDSDTISGTWTNASVGSGTFSGFRNSSQYNATYRFISRISGTDTGFFAFDVDANGNVTGQGYTVFEHRTFQLTGSVNGNGNLVAGIPGETFFILTGILDRATGSLQGTWENTLFTPSGTGSFSGSGCKLN